MTIKEASTEIKRTVTMDRILALYGYQTDRAGFTRCPFHAGDNTASLKVYRDGRGWCCFGCHAGGTAIDFVMHADGVGFADAVRNIDQQLQLHLLETRPSVGGLSALMANKRNRVEEEKTKKMIMSAWETIAVMLYTEFDALDRLLRPILQKPKNERTAAEDSFLLAYSQECTELWLDYNYAKERSLGHVRSTDGETVEDPRPVEAGFDQ